jgi:hypothetical protein
VKPKQIIMQFAAQIVNILLFLEMSEQSVKQEQLRVGSGHRATDRREVMQKTERPRERCLAALIGPRDDDDPLASIEKKIIGHDR